MAQGHGALDPLDRMSEVLFGLIMVLSFTGSISVATAGREEIRLMIVGALGCNFAWGIVDAVMYLLGRLVERSHTLSLLRRIQQAREVQASREAVGEALPSALRATLTLADLDRLAERARTVPEPQAFARLTGADIRGAVAVFLLVFASTFPVVIPFFVFRTVPSFALRVSNGVALAMLYAGGHALGRHEGLRPVPLGLAMMGVGSVLVFITIALGG